MEKLTDPECMCEQRLKDADFTVCVDKQQCEDKGCMRYTLMRLIILIVRQHGFNLGGASLFKISNLVSRLASTDGVPLQSNEPTPVAVALQCMHRLFQPGWQQKSSTHFEMDRWILYVHNAIFSVWGHGGNGHSLLIAGACVPCKKLCIRDTVYAEAGMVDVDSFIEKVRTLASEWRIEIHPTLRADVFASIVN